MNAESIELRVVPVPVQIYYLLGAAIVSLTLAGCGFALWVQSPYVVGGGTTLWEYTPSGLVGMLLLTSFTASTVALFYEASQLFVRHTQEPTYGMSRVGHRTRSLAIVLQALLSVCYAVVGCVAMAKWGTLSMRCGVLFCLDVLEYPAVKMPRGVVFNSLLSMMLFFTLVPLALVMWCRIFTLLCKERQRTASFISLRKAKPPVLQLFHPPRWWWRVIGILGLCFSIFFFAVLTSWLPNDPRKFLPNALAAYAALGISRVARSDTMTVPELPNAWMRTGWIRLSPSLTLKFYPSTVLFYGYLLSVSITLFVVSLTRRASYWSARRLPGRLGAFTVAEALLIGVTVLMSTLFLIYWLHDHNYRVLWRGEPMTGSPMLAAENWSRSLGQLAVLFLSILLLPMSRRSIVVNVLGVSRDGLLWFHRAVGYAMLAATVGHIVASYVSYAHYGQLLHNLTFLPMIIGVSVTRGNFTVAIVSWPTWILLIAMGLLALNVVRRYCYELFYYAHLFAAYASLPVILFHASAGWMYLLPGMTVLLADQLVRLWQRSAVVRVVHARVIGEDTTELAFSVPGRWDMRRVHPGQYVLVCVPELTALQWHPFTLTNVVDKESVAVEGSKVSATGTVFYVHVKSMGPRTWTGRLYDLVRTGQVFSMAVEGPCGTPVDYSHYDNIVLVAGGIGATPCISIFGSLLRQHEAAGNSRACPRVDFIWSTRSAHHVQAVADMLQLPVRCGDVVHPPVANSESTALMNKVPPPHLSASDKEFTEQMSFNVYLTGDNVSRHFFCASDSQGSNPYGDLNGSAKLDGGLQEVVRSGAGSKYCNCATLSQEQATASTTQKNEHIRPWSREKSHVGSLTPPLDTVCNDMPRSPPTPLRVGPHDSQGQARDYERKTKKEGGNDKLFADLSVPVKLLDTKVNQMDRGKRGVLGGAVLEVHAGRPDVARLITDKLESSEAVLDGTYQDKTRTLVFVCGPEKLAGQVVAVGAKLGVTVHTEVFLF